MKKIWLSPPHLGVDEKKYVDEAFATNWISPFGKNLDDFEERLSSYLKRSHVVCLSSGTAALHLAFLALGVKEGDVVLCQSFTFAATAFAVKYCNAEPVFVDSDIETWNMDPNLLETTIKNCIKIGKRPSAVVVVHLYGMPAKIHEILEICNRYQIPLVEDAAEALGSEYENRKCGSFGAISILSFNGNKIITTSGGGALCTDDKKIAEKVRLLANQAKADVTYYFHETVGYNYRLSNVLAGIGKGQMNVLAERVLRKREIFEWYKENLKHNSGVCFQNEPNSFFSNRWLTTLFFDHAYFKKNVIEKLILKLANNNIEARHLWKPLHQQPVFNQSGFINMGVSDYLFHNGICLPSGTDLQVDELERVIKLIKVVLRDEAI